MARKILLADDSVTAQNMGRKILTDAGYEVVTVNNGSAALKKILEAKPDLVVLDVYMPGYSGLEVCQRIKENRDSSRIPILLTVGKLEPFKPEEARRVRADAFVVKPFEASELLAALARLEDKIVPQPEPYKQGRFARAVAAVDDLAGAERDESWKARLRIPVHGEEEAKAEPEREVATPAKGFRDFTGDDSRHKTKAPHREGVFEPPLPSGLPGDITPEEIAALTAAAAQLRGSGSHPPLPDLHASVPVSPALADVAAPVVDRENSSPVTFASAPQAPAPSDGVSLAQAGTESAKEVAAETASASGSNGAVMGDPAPNDASTDTEAAEVPEGKVTQEVPAPDVAKIDPPITHTMRPEVALAEPAISDIEAAAPPDSNVLPTVASGATVELAAQAADDEVMAALQSLMPVDGNGPTPGTKPESHATPGIAAMIAQVDSAAVKAHAAGPRWIAEEVALAEDEASLSLEREMEQAYAAAAASGGVRATSTASVVEAAHQVSAEISTAESVGTAPSPEPQPAESAVAYAMAASASEMGAIHSSQAVAVPHTEPQGIETGAAGTGVPAVQASQPAVKEPSFTPSIDSQRSPDIEISGGVEDMAASWKNIRDSIATGGAAKAAPAKEKDEVRAADAGDAQGAAPTTPEPGTHSSASDPKAIASIVDSVLAELRPKIVEEIAKKLADSKKE